MSSQLRQVHEALVSELRRMRELHEEAVEQVQIKQSEDRDGAEWSEMLPQAAAKANAAEDAVERAAIMAEMVSENGEDVEEARNAIALTEQAVNAAQVAICEARIFLSSKVAIVQKYSKKIKADADSQLGRQQKQLKEANDKLVSLKTLRADFERKHEVEQAIEETSRILGLAEVDVDKAEELVLRLGETEHDEGLFQSVRQALTVAADHITNAVREVEAKGKASSDTVRAELDTHIKPRVVEAKARLKQFEDSYKDATERSRMSVLVSEASEKVADVTATLLQLDEIEGRLQESQEASLQEVLDLTAEADKIAAGASSSTSAARVFIQMKNLEVKRLKGAAGQKASQQLQDFSREVDAAHKRLQEVKTSVLRLRRTAMAKDAENEVAAIEECLVNVKQAASAFTDDVQLTLLSVDEIREARESAMAEEKKTSEMIAKAKQSIMTKQIEAKGNQGSPEVSQELMKLQARLSVAQTELGKLRISFSSVDQQLSSKRVIEEAEQKLKAVEVKVAAITTAISNFVSDEDSPATLQDEKKECTCTWDGLAKGIKYV
jgi:hypothetical protein